MRCGKWLLISLFENDNFRKGSQNALLASLLQQWPLPQVAHCQLHSDSSNLARRIVTGSPKLISVYHRSSQLTHYHRESETKNEMKLVCPLFFNWSFTCTTVDKPFSSLRFIRNGRRPYFWSFFTHLLKFNSVTCHRKQTDSHESRVSSHHKLQKDFQITDHEN